MKYNPEMITLARQLSGMSQLELAKKLGVSRTLLSMLESGDRTLTPEIAKSISAAIGRPESLLRWNGEICAPSTVFHRKKASVKTRDLEKTNAFINLARLKVQRVLSRLKVKFRRKLFRLDFASDRSASEAAKRLRAAWQLPPGPIKNLTEVVESAGIIVWPTSELAVDVDGLSLWPLGDDDFPPVIVVVDGKPSDRQRLTLAHELGHLALHHVPVEDFEREANEFAAEFLMPEDEIADDLKGMTLPKAAALKSKWRVSMQALIRRSAQLGQITDSTYRRLMIEVNTKGYRVREPILLTPEYPQLLPALMQRFSELYADCNALAEELGEIPGVADFPVGPKLKLFG